jgi:hypothetical protein
MTASIVLLHGWRRDTGDARNNPEIDLAGSALRAGRPGRLVMFEGYPSIGAAGAVHGNRLETVFRRQSIGVRDREFLPCPRVRGVAILCFPRRFAPIAALGTRVRWAREYKREGAEGGCEYV